MSQIFVGLFTEGSTDVRFLESIVKNTLHSLAYDECTVEIDIEVVPLGVATKGLKFNEKIIEASKKGIDDFGMTMLCVQADSDNKTLEKAYSERIRPALAELAKLSTIDYCQVVVPIVPIQETEAWMLADTELLKQEIGTDKSDTELGINRPPESISDPKQVIIDAIRIAREGMTRRRRNDLSISDLYLPIGQAIELDKLESLASYQDFKENIRKAFRQLNLLHS